MMTEQWPSLAQGRFPITMLELFSRGYKNLETVYFPNYVNLSYCGLARGSGMPITSKEFFMAWEEVSRDSNLDFFYCDISKLDSISAFFW